MKDTQLLQPLFEFSGACAGCGETPYLKILSQLFGDRAMIANATGCSSIYGGNLPTTPWTVNGEGRGPAWSNSLFEDNSEFGLGMRLALDHQEIHARHLLKKLSADIGDKLVQLLLDADQSQEIGINEQRERVKVLKDKLRAVDRAEARDLQVLADSLVKKSVWIWSYGSGSRRAVRLFERALKCLVLLMSLFFLIVVIRTGVDLKALLKGFFGFHIPRDREGLTIVLGALGAAVGVNMTFLYPYTLLARGWGWEHRGLKNFDLVVSMFAPFVLTTSLVVIACANTLHVQGIQVRAAVDAAHALAPVAGIAMGRVVFSLGVLAMCFTTLTIEMVICGFVLSEMLGFEPRGWRYRAATMTANIGILGAFYPMPFWLLVLASSTALVMMPIAYIAFFILENKRSYLGDAVPKGLKRTVWKVLLLLAILVVAAGAVVKIISLVR